MKITRKTLRFVGQGKAATAMAAACSTVGYELLGFLGRSDDLFAAAHDADILILAVADDAIAEVAGRIAPNSDCLVLHLSGSRGLDVLAGHERRAGLHPLVALPNAEVGAQRLLDGATFAIAGDPSVLEIVERLGGIAIPVRDDQRAAYHAAATVAANHVVALMGHLEAIASEAGLSLETFLPLARAAINDVEELGASAALTGPASRGDWETLQRHLDAIAPEEQASYRAGVAMTLRLLAASGAPIKDAAVESLLPVH